MSGVLYFMSAILEILCLGSGHSWGALSSIDPDFLLNFRVALNLFNIFPNSEYSLNINCKLI